jgi:hypothetical protein
MCKLDRLIQRIILGIIVMILSKAIAQVVEANQPRIRLQVMPTGGTVENMDLLAAQKVQLATAQADISAGQSSRVVAVLYRSSCQFFKFVTQWGHFAVAALVSEEISQESFRTFNEVYKDVREALERKI